MPGGGWQLGIDDIGNVLCVLFLSLILHITLAPPRHALLSHARIAALLNLRNDICLLNPLHTYPFSLSMFLNIFVILCRSQIRTLSKMEMKPRAQSGAERAAKLGDTRRKCWQLLWLQTSTTSTIKCEIYYCLYLYLITISIQSKSVPLLVLYFLLKHTFRNLIPFMDTGQ